MSHSLYQSCAFVLVLGPAVVSCSAPRQPPAANEPSRGDPTDGDAVAAGTPAVFAPGIVSGPSNDMAPAFTPDGSTVYFTRDHTILVSHRSGGRWSAPQVAPFSGRWGDSEPAIAPDGSFLIFVSNRPAVEPGTALDGEWGYPKRRVFKSNGANLWRVDRQANGWGPPARLPDTVNRGTAVWEPCVVADGSLYFMDAHLPGRFRLYRSQYQNGSYQEPVPLGFNDGTWSDVDASVAPDESFLVFASNRPPVDGERHELFIAFRTEGSDQTAGPVGSMTWGEITHLGPTVNDPAAYHTNPRLGPDRHTLYFTTDRTTPPTFPRTRASLDADLQRAATWDNRSANIWWIDLAPWLATHSQRTRG